MQLFINILFQSGLLLIINLSFSISYNSARFFNFAHAVVITSSAYLTFLFISGFSISLPISIILAITFTTFIGLTNDFLFYRPMRKKNMSLWSYLISSLGLYFVLQNLISLYFGDDTKILRIGEVTVGHEFFGAYIATIQITTIFVSIALFILVKMFLQLTKTGKSIRAVSNNPELCNVYGIDSNKIILICFGIGSMLGAVAGILSAMDTDMTPTFGFNLLLYGVVAMIIGGVGSAKGLVSGSFLVAASQNLGAYYIDTKWMDAIAFIILILFLIWKPLGFSGMRLKKVEV